MIGIVIVIIECFIIANFIIKSLGPRILKTYLWLLYIILAALLFIDIEFAGKLFESESITGILQIIICIIFSIVFLKGSIYKKILISVISNLLILIINVSIISILSLFIDGSIVELMELYNVVWLYAVLLSKLCYFLITNFLLAVQKKVPYQISIKEGGAILLIFIVTLLIGIMILEQNIVTGNYESNYLMVSMIGLIIINILSFYILTYISKENERKLKYYMLDLQIKNHKNEVIEVQKQYKELQKIRHDFKNYILCSLSLLKENKTDEAKKYLTDILDEKLTPEISYINTSNSAVNAILNAKLNKCKQLGIETNYDIVDHMEIDDIDISILLANLFDNSIEACNYNTSKSSISLIITYEKAYLNIIMKNSIEKSVLKDNPNLHTTKKDKTKHGYGLKTIDDIVKKYDGINKYYEKGNFFYADIWLKQSSLSETHS